MDTKKEIEKSRKYIRTLRRFRAFETALIVCQTGLLMIMPDRFPCINRLFILLGCCTITLLGYGIGTITERIANAEFTTARIEQFYKTFDDVDDGADE